MSSAEPCELRDWDTRHFGFRVAQVRGDCLTPEIAGRVGAWCREQAIVCLYLLANADDGLTGQVAAAEGFVLADVRVTFARLLDAGAVLEAGTAGGIRAGRAEDILALRRIAASSFGDSRFYNDPRFPRDRCDELYAIWIENACRRGQAAVLVAEREGRPAGFITCERAGDSTGQIGLVAVDAAAQGRGLGRALVEAALHWFQCRGFHQVLVRTQARNHRAGRLYEGCGFVPQSLHCWYHRWFEPCPAVPGSMLESRDDPSQLFAGAEVTA